MAFKTDFKLYEGKSSQGRIKNYYTSHGNRCERKKKPASTNLISIIRAHSIESFFAELKDGTELMDMTRLSYKTNDTDIWHPGFRTATALKTPRKININTISEEDGKKLFKTNKGLFNHIYVGAFIEKGPIAGILWVLKDPTVSNLTTLSRLQNMPQVLSWASYLKNISISAFSFVSSTKIYHFARLEALQQLGLYSVSFQSKNSEIRFFKSLETLPNLKRLNYNHQSRLGSNINISYTCKLPVDYNCSSLGRLLNLWKPNSEVKCTVHLFGKFTKLFCRYVLSRVFSTMTDLTELLFSWGIFGEKQSMISNPKTLRPTGPFPEKVEPIHNTHQNHVEESDADEQASKFAKFLREKIRPRIRIRVRDIGPVTNRYAEIIEPQVEGNNFFI